jgi:uncharacterized protein
MFTITLSDANGERSTLHYDPHRSILADDGGLAVDPRARGLAHAERRASWPEAPRVRDAEPGRKSHRIRRLKIQLGLGCNYSCAYCLQRFQPEVDATGADDALAFLGRLPRHFDGGEDGLGQGVRIEFWGGEPFLYFKRSLRTLGLALRSAYPHASFGIVTNGSLLTDEIIEWIEAVGCSVAVSHDGPGQAARGPDPLADPIRRERLFALHDRLAPQGRFSFNVTLTAASYDLAAIHAWFGERLDGRQPVLDIEGAALPYSPDAYPLALGAEQQRAVMLSLFHAIVHGPGLQFGAIRRKLHDFFGALAAGRPSSALGQKCGMDRSDSLAVTLAGDVVTCQNTSPAAEAPNGRPHHIGTFDALDDVRLDTATHWSWREECAHCPVLQLCQGSCMFLQGESWARACHAEFAYNMGIFLAALWFLTGKAPIYIDGPIRRPALASAAP